LTAILSVIMGSTTDDGEMCSEPGVKRESKVSVLDYGCMGPGSIFLRGLPPFSRKRIISTQSRPWAVQRRRREPERLSPWRHLGDIEGQIKDGV